MRISQPKGPVRNQRLEAPKPAAPQSAPSEASEEVPSDGWVSAGLCILGGGSALLGAVTGNGLLTTGGACLAAVASVPATLRAHRRGQVDTATAVAFAGVGLSGAAALVNLGGKPSAGSQMNGPLAEFLRLKGVQIPR